MVNEFKFSEGEKIICFHGPLLYEAKCLKVRKNKKGVCEYFVHYAGWNKSWDEWITDVRMLKYNEENLARKKELLKASKDMKRLKRKNWNAECSDDEGEKATTSTSNVKTGKASNSNNNCNADSSEDESTSVTNKKKRVMNDPTIESEEQFTVKVEIKVKMPDTLKPWLVDDWNLICHQKKIVCLPAKVTVDNILENYMKQKNKSGVKESPIGEIVANIKEYFNTTLGSKLLYRQERIQYGEILEKYPGRQMSSIYGSIHLLRLFVILGNLLVYTQIDERTVQLLQFHLQDFLKYLQRQSGSLFSFQNYCCTTAAYQRKLLQL